MQLLSHREKSAPRLGSEAPVLTLVEFSSNTKKNLASFWSKKPCVMMFGSSSCNRTWDGTQEIQKLFEKYGEKFQFVFIYLREAHPENGWKFYNQNYPVVHDSTDDLKIRRSGCETFYEKYKVAYPILIDDMTDTAAVAYAAWPSRLYVVDQKGVIKYQGHPGPWGYKPTDSSEVYALTDAPPEQMSFVPDPTTAISLETFLREYQK